MDERAVDEPEALPTVPGLCPHPQKPANGHDVMHRSATSTQKNEMKERTKTPDTFRMASTRGERRERETARVHHIQTQPPGEHAAGTRIALSLEPAVTSGQNTSATVEPTGNHHQKSPYYNRHQYHSHTAAPTGCPDPQ